MTTQLLPKNAELLIASVKLNKLVMNINEHMVLHGSKSDAESAFNDALDALNAATSKFDSALDNLIEEDNK